MDPSRRGASRCWPRRETRVSPPLQQAAGRFCGMNPAISPDQADRETVRFVAQELNRTWQSGRGTELARLQSHDRARLSAHVAPDVNRQVKAGTGEGTDAPNGTCPRRGRMPLSMWSVQRTSGHHQSGADFSILYSASVGWTSNRRTAPRGVAMRRVSVSCISSAVTTRAEIHDCGSVTAIVKGWS